MESAVVNGRALGYIKVPDSAFADASELKSLPADKVMILCTGSQGEQMAALSRIANGTHRQISIEPGDTVVLSSNPIPGNVLSVNRVLNELEEAGAHVIKGYENKIHTSGHGGQEEEKLMIRLMKPKFFVPIHGEYRMQKIHIGLAEQCGIPADHCFILKNGEVLALTKDTARLAGSFVAGDVFIDGNGVDSVNKNVIKDRQLLSEEGLVVVVATINLKDKEIQSGPDLLSRGFVYMRESGELLDQGRKLVFKTIRRTMDTQNADEKSIKKAIVNELSNFLFEKTERRP